MCAPFHNEKSLNPEGKKGEDRAKVVLQKKPPEHFNIIKLTFRINVSCCHSELLLIKPLPLLQASNVNPIIKIARKVFLQFGK